MLVPASAPGQADSTARATVKILDIGLGRALFDEAAPDKAPDPTLTSEGAVLGTPDYMSPEQARDARATDIRSDIYSLGCVLYHTLAGQPPFPDSNLISQMIRHATEAPRPLVEFNPAVPDGLQQIVGWMMAKDPGQRYPTPGRAAQALYVFLAAEADAAAGPEADPRMHSYLSWLEAESSKEDVALPALPAGGPARPSSGTIPAAGAPPRPAPPTKPPAPAPTAVPAKPAAAPPDARQPGRKHRHRKRPRASRQEIKTARPAEFDVELVPAAAPATNAGFQLTRRDLLVFGLGVGSTLFTILVSWLLARLFARRAPAPLPSEEESSNHE
jgi:serine/threonine protein kinase